MKTDMKTMEQRLFTPGDGATPPALTGREREEAVMERCLADLLGGASLAVAERVAERYRSQPTPTYEELKVAVADGRAGDAGQVHEALNALQRLGFVWRPPGQLPPVRYEPGIPSLMAHVLDHAVPEPT